jgi:hypothetical protein
MNIVEKVVDLYYSLRFAVEDLYYKVKDKFGFDDAEYNYADYSNPVDKVVEEKPKKKKKKKTTKKKK